MRKFVLVLAALLLAGCGEVRWARPDGDAGSAARDEANCRAAAREQLLRQYGPPRVSTAPPDASRFGPETSAPGPADRQVLEAQAVERCMRGKGYALVPAGK